jgi:carboxypeptidase family protein
MLGRKARSSFLAGTLLLIGVVAAAHAAGPTAAGRITDLRGHAIAGALVRAESWGDEPLGAARSDAQGRFQVPLSRSVKDLTLIVEHPGFQRWAVGSASPEPDGTYPIRLTRIIDRGYLTELAAQTELARFWLLGKDLLAPSFGTTGETMPLDQILPFLKTLRERLRALLPAEPAQLKQRELKEGKEHNAALLLAYLGDPHDDVLIDALAAKVNFISRRQHYRGPTPEAAARAWQEAHFKKEGYRASQPVPPNYLDIQIAPSGDHGLALHTVRYLNWGYSQHLVLVRLGKTWEVRRVIDNEHWHRQF